MLPSVHVYSLINAGSMPRRVVIDVARVARVIRACQAVIGLVKCVKIVRGVLRCRE
jgi:hypothetical protein